MGRRKRSQGLVSSIVLRYDDNLTVRLELDKSEVFSNKENAVKEIKLFKEMLDKQKEGNTDKDYEEQMYEISPEPDFIEMEVQQTNERSIDQEIYDMSRFFLERLQVDVVNI